VSGALQAWWRGECAAQPGSGMYATRVVEAPPGGSALPAEMRLTCKQDSQAPWAEVARAARFGPEESERRAHQAVGLRSCSMHRSRNLERVRTVRVAVLLFRIQAAGRAASTCVQAVLCTPHVCIAMRANAPIYPPKVCGPCARSSTIRIQAQSEVERPHIAMLCMRLYHGLHGATVLPITRTPPPQQGHHDGVASTLVPCSVGG